MKLGRCDPLIFMGLIGASIAMGRSGDLYYSDGEPKEEADLMRVPWIAKRLRQEAQERHEWRRSHGLG